MFFRPCFRFAIDPVDVFARGKKNESENEKSSRDDLRISSGDWYCRPEKRNEKCPLSPSRRAEICLPYTLIECHKEAFVFASAGFLASVSWASDV